MSFRLMIRPVVLLAVCTAFAAALSSAEAPAGETLAEILELSADDECRAAASSGSAACALSALQLRGQGAAAHGLTPMHGQRPVAHGLPQMDGQGTLAHGMPLPAGPPLAEVDGSSSTLELGVDRLLGASAQGEPARQGELEEQIVGEHAGGATHGVRQGHREASPGEAATPADGSVPICADEAACLRIVDAFLEEQPRGPLGLLQIHSMSLGGGPCGSLCTLGPPEGRCDVYDNAVAAIYFTKRGHLEMARPILDVFVELLYPQKLAGIQPKALYHDVPSGRVMTLLAASYSSKERARAGVYWGKAVWDGAVDTGDNAWAGLALVHFAAATGEACYASAARDLLHALHAGGSCGDALGGFMGRMPPYAGNFRSTEHNIDMVAFARALGDDDVQAQAQRFVRGMFGRNPTYPRSFSMGTGNHEPCDSSQPLGPVPADATYWNLLAGADPDPAGTHMAAALRFALQSPPPEKVDENMTQGLWEEDEDLIWDGAPRPRLNGTRFTTWGHGVQWEVSAGAGMAMARYRQAHADGNGLFLTRYTREIRDSLRHLLAMYGSVPGSVLGGNVRAYEKNNHHAAYPGGSDTGIRWSYFRYPHVAGTAWTGLFFLYQFDDDGPVNEDANPFAPPATPVPAALNLSCLPPPPKAQAASDSCCAGGPGVRKLGCCPDSCCPKDDGIFLGCCAVGQPPLKAPPPSRPQNTSASSSGGCCAPGKELGCCHTGGCCPTSNGVNLACCAR